MSQFTRKKLSRGVKLLLEHVYTPATAVAAALSSSGILTESIRDKDTSFRVTVSVPQFSGWHQYQWNVATTYTPADGTRPFCFPFAIPQPQEEFDPTGIITATTTKYALDEVSVSFDQAGENAAVCAHGNTAAYAESFLAHNDAQHLSLKVAIVEKTMLSVNSAAGFDPDREVFSGFLDAKTFYSGRFLRLNPFVFSSLNKQVHPYKTLMLCINAEGLRPPGGFANSVNQYLTLPAFTVSMKFKCDRVRRDVIADNVQNMPLHDGAATADTVTIATPTSDTSVLADGAEGVDTEIAVLDAKLQNRLWSGYTKQADVSGLDHFAKDSGLEVIAVPLWSNFSQDGRLNGATAGDAVNANVGRTSQICDERWIPIGYPFVIHHCLIGLNYGAGKDDTVAGYPNAAVKPAVATLTGEIGVAMVSGIIADNLAYQQVAYLTYTPTTLPNFVIDRIRHNENQTLTDFDHVFDLVQVPLVSEGATVGIGYNNLAGTPIAQGAPVFVGKGAASLTTEGRSQIGDYLNVAANPPTNGAEQYLCVRQSFIDSAGMGTNGATVFNNTTYAGVGGHMLYLIGKKTVVGGREPVMSAGR